MVLYCAQSCHLLQIILDHQRKNTILLSTLSFTITSADLFTFAFSSLSPYFAGLYSFPSFVLPVAHTPNTPFLKGDKCQALLYS